MAQPNTTGKGTNGASVKGMTSKGGTGRPGGSVGKTYPSSPDAAGKQGAQEARDSQLGK